MVHEVRIPDAAPVPEVVAPADVPSPPEVTDQVEPADEWHEDSPADVEPEVVVPPQPIPCELAAKSQYGGYAALQVAPGSGFFTTGLHEGRAWLVDPEGHAFLSVGLQAVGFGSLSSPALGYAPGTLAQLATYAPDYPDLSGVPSAVQAEHVDAMLEYGFNTIGAWTGGGWGFASGKLAYTMTLGFAGGVTSSSLSSPVPVVSQGGFPDVFHPDFPAMCQEYVQGQVPAQIVDDPWLLGYFTDNELRWWGGDFFVESKTWTLMDDFMDEAAETPGKEALAAYLEARYEGDLAAFNAAYGLGLAHFAELGQLTKLPLDPQNQVHVDDRLGFVDLVAEAYFSHVDEALTEVDVNHLNLCVRFASAAPDPVVRRAGEFCDVVTLNDYYIKGDPISDLALGGTPVERWSKYAALLFAGAGGPTPLLVSEWGIRADDSGLPNTYGAGHVTATQQERADFYEWSARWFLAREEQEVGYVSGWHWFMYMDEPATGRFDGEDGNYGIVTIRDEKYGFLLEGMLSSNRAGDHLVAKGEMPTLLAPPETVSVQEAAEGFHLTWDEVPLAEGYEVFTLTHPAGLENRVAAAAPWSAAPEILLPLDDVGHGLVWLAVRPVGEGLLSGGVRTVGPVVTSPSVSPGILAATLDCEDLGAVHFQNAFPLPNDAPGQSYVRLEKSFLEGEGQALHMEFVPSSLAFVEASPYGDNAVSVAIKLPLPVDVLPGQELKVELLPYPLVKSGKQVVPASDYVYLSVSAPDGSHLAQVKLSDIDAAVMVAQQVAIPLAAQSRESPAQVSQLRFHVELLDEGLPMEQAVRLTVDRFVVE